MSTSLTVVNYLQHWFFEVFRILLSQKIHLLLLRLPRLLVSEVYVTSTLTSPALLLVQTQSLFILAETEKGRMTIMRGEPMEQRPKSTNYDQAM